MKIVKIMIMIKVAVESSLSESQPLNIQIPFIISNLYIY